MITQTDLEMAPCLEHGRISGAARELVEAARTLPASGVASSLKTWCLPFLFQRMEHVLESGAEPFTGANLALSELAAFLRAAHVSGISEWIAPKVEWPTEAHAVNGSVEQATGEHYGRLFEAFSSASYWDEPTRLLRQRLERNQVEMEKLSSQEVLDAGCGGGRYTVAWKKLGARAAVGFDVSKTGLSDARQRVQCAGIDGVTFEEGNVLELPFARDRFDVVFSNGVLHHTRDWKLGVKELVRVLKPGGLGWLYLIENPGGLFWDIIEILRVIMRDEQPAVARRVLNLVGLPANRIFYMLDHVMVPINVRLTPAEIEACLAEAGATRIRRLERGCDFDRVEKIFQRAPFADAHFGVGENRFVFTKA